MLEEKCSHFPFLIEHKFCVCFLLLLLSLLSLLSTISHNVSSAASCPAAAVFKWNAFTLLFCVPAKITTLAVYKANGIGKKLGKILPFQQRFPRNYSSSPFPQQRVTLCLVVIKVFGKASLSSFLKPERALTIFCLAYSSIHVCMSSCAEPASWSLHFQEKSQCHRYRNPLLFSQKTFHFDFSQIWSGKRKGKLQTDLEPDGVHTKIRVEKVKKIKRKLQKRSYIVSLAVSEKVIQKDLTIRGKYFGF